MALTPYFDKDPKAQLDYTVNWFDWLEGDQITGSSWTAVSENPPGIFVDTSTFTTGSTTIWLVSGTIDQVYRFDNLIGTVEGRRDSRHIYIRVKDK